jgi:hypothetical protein
MAELQSPRVTPAFAPALRGAALQDEWARGPCARCPWGVYVALAVCAWLGARSLPVLALSDVFFYGEELEKGAIAVLLQAWARGALDLPWTSLPYHPYEGGGYFASHLKAVAFLLVGENVLAHKLCSLFWGVLVLLAALRCARRQLGEATARWLALLLVFAPLHVQRQSLLHLGIHFEALFFVFLVLDLGLTLVCGPRGARWPARTLLALGLVGGFGLWFSYQLALPLALVAVALAWARPRELFGRGGLLGLAGFVLGALPLGVMALDVGRGVLDLHGAAVGGAGGFARLGSFLSSLGTAITRDPVALVQTIGLALLALVGLVGALRQRTTRAVGLVLAAYFVLWLVSAAASGLVPKAYGHWFALLRWAPPVVLLLVCAAHGVVVASGRSNGHGGSSASGARGAQPRLALGAAWLVVGTGAVQTVRLATEGQLGAWRTNLTTLCAAPGAEWVQTCTKLVPRLVAADALGEEPGRVARLVAAAHDIADNERAKLELLTAVGAGYGAVSSESFEVAHGALERRLPNGGSPPERRALAMGLGQRLCADLGAADGWSALAALAAAGVAGAAHDTVDTLDLRAEALGRYGSGWVLFPAFVTVELAAVRDLPGASAYRRGLGARAYHSLVLAPFGGLGEHRFVLQPERFRAWLLGTVPEAEARDVLVGFDGAPSE